jgi:MFS family permease
VVAASGTLVLVLAVGMTLGPTLGAFAIEYYGPNGLFYLLSIISSITVMTAFFRLWSGQPQAENPSIAVAMAANLTPEATHLYPDASYRSRKSGN